MHVDDPKEKWGKKPERLPEPSSSAGMPSAPKGGKLMAVAASPEPAEEQDAAMEPPGAPSDTRPAISSRENSIDVTKKGSRNRAESVATRGDLTSGESRRNVAHHASLPEKPGTPHRTDRPRYKTSPKCGNRAAL